MKRKGAQVLGVLVFGGVGTILLCMWGCTSEPKPVALDNGQAHATQARALPDQAAPEKAPVGQMEEGARTEATPPAATAQPIATYIVRQGDTLSSISQKYYGTRANWKLIMDANPNVLKSPKDLKPNMKLVIPAAKTTPAKAGAAE